MRRLRLAPIVVALLVSAQARAGTISVGVFTAEKTCTTYELEWGREFAASASASASAGEASGNFLGGSASYGSASRSASIYAREWGTELRRECVRNFPAVRSTLASALASAGPVASPDGPLTLTGRLTGVGYESQTVDTAGSAIADQFMVVGIEFALRNRAGRIVYGGALTKRLNIDAGSETADVSFSRSQSGRTTFAQLQQQVAYAVARNVLFHLHPLRVVANDGKAIALNYGTPLVPLGSAVLVPSATSLRGRRLTVVSARNDQAVAESDAHAALQDVPVGAVVTFAEADDPAANSRVFQRVELPEN
ncbi:MAG: hypothetical protein KGN34_16750 [Sphingomonadales bacterium]|nr:hypothetical protein [Sphingomonadales bacterium]